MTPLARPVGAPLRLVEIGEAARGLGVTTRTLRHYEDQGLVRSHRLARKVRGYDPATVERLGAIVTLRAVGLPIGAIRTILALARDPDVQAQALHAALADAMREQQARLERLVELAGRVAAAGGALPAALAGLGDACAGRAAP